MLFSDVVFFMASTCLISAMPGSNMLLAFQFGLNYGVKNTLWTLTGLSFGLFVLLASSLLGLGVISQTAPMLLVAIKVLGALYLAYLGFQSIRHAKEALSENAVKVTPTPRQLFKTGFWVALSNPKAILFFAAFFPKFINFNALLMPQYVILTLGFLFIETTWQLIYTTSGKKLAGWLSQGERLAWLNRICGLIFIAIAGAMLWDVVAK